MEYICFICKKKVSNRARGFGSHFKRYHNLALKNYTGRTREFVCAQAQGDCKQRYLLFSSLLRHIHKHHINTSDNIAPDNFHETLHVPDNSHEILPSVNEANAQCSTESSPGCSRDITTSYKGFDAQLSSLKSNIAKELLAFQSKSNVTFTVADAAVKTCSSVAKSITDTVKKELLDFFNKEKIDVGRAECSALMQKIETLADPFTEIKTKYQQISYYKQNFGLIEPREVCLGSRQEQFYNQTLNKYVTKFVPDTFQYVPIIDTLFTLLRNAQVLKYVQNNERVPEGQICSYSSAKQFKMSQFFKKFPDAIQIQLYYDEVEVCNPLGSKTKIHEIATFYFSILNIPCNSTLTNIHLLTMCNSQDLKKYGFTAVLQPFMDDLKILEADEGIVAKINGMPFTLRATIACVCADGLAAHALFGFLSPSAKYFCRLCMAKREDIQERFRVREFEKREKISHDQHVIDSELNLDASRNSGVKERCALNASKYFHCIDNFCFDAMHDLLEGVCGMELKLVLNQWMYAGTANKFSVATFNNRLQSFKYGFSDRKNKPSPNFTRLMITSIKDHKLKQKASQTWCLMRVLPFILNGLVLPSDKFFHLIHLLARIMQIIFSPIVTEGLASYLESLIIQHHEEFKEIFPGSNLINKHHHLIHYPDCIINFGPLVKMWCMRYEAKHNFFKQRSSINSNFKNISKSLALSHQLAHCTAWSVNDPFAAYKTSSEESVWIVSCDSYSYLKLLGYKDNSVVKIAKTVTLHGVEYRKEIIVLLKTASQSEESSPSFCQLKEIVLLPNNSVYFLVKLWTTTDFNPFFNAYSVKLFDHNSLKFINAAELPDHHIYSLWTPFGSTENFISLRSILL